MGTKLTIPSASKDAKQQERTMQTDITIMENSFATSYESKHTLTIGPSKPTLRYLPKKNENLG